MPRECLLREVIRADNPLKQTSTFLSQGRARRVIFLAKVVFVNGLDVSCEDFRQASLDAYTSVHAPELKSRLHAESKRILDFTS